MAVLVLNAGSSSLKLAGFGADLSPLIFASVAEIGGAARLTLGGQSVAVDAANHAEALGALLDRLGGIGLGAAHWPLVGHRVVHGGPHLTGPRRIDAATLAAIEAAAPLAPLHNPPAIAAIRAIARLVPDARQVACFDTAFHATNPPEALLFALPDLPETAGLRRYGFHGLSYASLVEALPRQTGVPLPRRLLAFHLGNGASACAIVEGRSVATTMGYSPLDGLVMGTRAGSLDPEAVLVLAERVGLARARAILNRESGLAGLSGGVSDMRALLASPLPAAEFAISHFCHWAVRHGGALIAAMGGVDALAFTGGIGEHAAPVRDRIAGALAWLTPEVHVVPAAEERLIAREALQLPG